MYARKNFFLVKKLDEKIMLLQAGGFIKFWQSQDAIYRNLDDDETRRKQAMSVRDLIGCFQMLLSGCVLGIAAFVFELYKARVTFVCQ
jgi:hypothetical protein